MHVLFVHSNFPAQFRYLAPRLAGDHGWRCTFVTRNATAPDVPGVERVLYHRRGGQSPSNHPCTGYFERTVQDAHGVYEALKERPDVKPDLVVAHSGFGSSLFLPHLYDAPVVNFFEYFFHARKDAFTFRPEVPVGEGDVLKASTNNSMILLDLNGCDRGWCPNFAQRDVMPKEYHGKIEVIPEGVDTSLYTRKPEARNPKSETSSNDQSTNDRNRATRVLPDGTVVPEGTRVVTYAARGFELMRGFDVFMAAAKRIYEQCRDVVFVVVGTDKPYYLSDAKLTGGKTLRRRILESGDYDLSRFHFTGWLSEDKLIDVLSMSDLHVYLTAPFITSWSMLDAMSCSCVVLASDQGCTREYINHGRNGLLCDFFDAEGIAQQAVEVLRDPAAYRPLGDAARRTIEEGYSLDACLPRIKAMFEDVVAKGPRTPSVRAETLVRAGAPAAWKPERETYAGPEVGVELPPFEGRLPFALSGTGDPPVSGTLVGAGREPPGEDHGRVARATSKTVLLAWELGAGLGHLMQVLPLAQDLAAQGHCVVVALRHLERAADVFGRAGVFYLQAPYRSPGARTVGGRVVAFAQLLANLGFGDDDELFALASAWRNLIRSVGPDLIVCDYSPTALLAARDFPEVPRATIGSGFCVPPDFDDERPAGEGAEGNGNGNGKHKPSLRPWALLRRPANDAELAAALAVEAETLERVNWVLEAWGREPLARLGQLFSDADETFLTTFPELDHFRDRPRAAYWGPVLCAPAGGEAEAPRWPEASGKRVFVYLKATPAAGDVLRVLRSIGCPTVAYVDGLGPAARKRLARPTLHLAERRVDVARAAAECDLAVLNGGHGVTAEMLLAGKPVLAVPLVLEQSMTAAALARLGAGEPAPQRGGEPWEWTGRAKLEAMLNEDGYARAAQRFADRYAAFDPDRQRAAMRARCEQLFSRGEDYLKRSTSSQPLSVA